MHTPPKVTPGRAAVGMWWDGEVVDLYGVNPWEYEWVSQREPIVVLHPLYPAQRHEVEVWSLRAPDVHIRFAAGEMSNLAWAFFLPTDA